MNRSQIHECRNWERGRIVSFLEIHKTDFRYSVAGELLPTQGEKKDQERGLFCFNSFYGKRALCAGWVGRHDPPHSRQCLALLQVSTESIERFIEDEAFLRSYEIAPQLHPPPLCRQHCLSFSSSCVSSLLGDGGGRGAKSYDRGKAWSSINNSILSGLTLTKL